MNFTQNLTNYYRNQTIDVEIGNTPVGGNNPIRLQSMTNTDTQNIDETVQQTIKIIEAEADYVRITTPNLKDVEALEQIKYILKSLGYNHPLVADIHFNNKAAEFAAMVVEKIRINPGNFINTSKNQNDNELELICEKFLPLLEICKKNNTAIRIGTNHGSLSPRIVEKYGDTPLGMVEATMEYLRICRDAKFERLVISLKSSNTVVMVQACRLLVSKMLNEDLNYPLHLGVTEAGEGEDGRIKSAIGIGALLVDGIGDTIRVSLTESPEKELPVAKQILEYSLLRKNQNVVDEIEQFFNPYELNFRQTNICQNIGTTKPPIVITDLSKIENIDNEILAQIGYKFIDNQYIKSDIASDYIYLGDKLLTLELDNFKIIQNQKVWKNQANCFPLFKFEEFEKSNQKSDVLNFVIINYKDIFKKNFEKVISNKSIVLILEQFENNYIGELRNILFKLHNLENKAPLIFSKQYFENKIESLQIKSSIDLSVFLIDGFVNGIFIKNDGEIEIKNIVETSFSILQAARLRTSKTEYISCPSCGRTLFDLEKTTAKVREKTSHLKGLKIAIMGCIVNGPGEMADADYGYVGAGVGRVTLYKNKDIIKKNIPEQDAVNELIELIKVNGDWIEK